MDNKIYRLFILKFPNSIDEKSNYGIALGFLSKNGVGEKVWEITLHSYHSQIKDLIIHTRILRAYLYLNIIISDREIDRRWSLGTRYIEYKDGDLDTDKGKIYEN